MKSDLLKILNGAVITETRNGNFINKYVFDCSCHELRKDLFNILYNIELIELDSGNFETHERHYMLNEKYISIKNNIKCVNLKEITNLIQCRSHIFYVTTEFCDAYFSIKKDIERKRKLNKLRNVSN